MTEPVLTVAHLRARIGAHQVVQDVSFAVAPTGVTALVGRNGVGKTSTLKALMGLIDRRGAITLERQSIGTLEPHRIARAGVGYVPEDREVFSGLTVAENMRLAARDGAPNRALVDALFPDLVARQQQRAGTLSGGQQQMLALARVLANDNRLLLIDEPTKGLAPRVVTDVVVALEQVAQTMPMLLVEQNLAAVRRLARQVVVMDAGRVVHVGEATELLDDRQALERYLGVRSEAGTGRERSAR